MQSTTVVAGDAPQGRRRPARNWKRTLRDLPVVEPSIVLPPDVNPGALSVYGPIVGARFVWRKAPDGSTQVWRIA